MMKKLRMLAALVCCLTLLLACALGENSRVIVDDAELLTAEERQTLTDTINRIGFDRAQELLLGDELLKRKAEILGLTVVGGATC